MSLPLANVLQPLIDVFDWVLVHIHDVIPSWGLSIIGLTIVVRALLIPLTLKQFKSMQALQQLAPEIKALQEKYKDDRQRLNQEMMKFYQENKVNPFGSCLPLVLQMPVFFSLFYMLRKDLKIDICGPESHILQVAHASGKTLTTIGCEQVKAGSAKFLFIPDLTFHATGVVLVVLLVLYVGSQLLSSVLMSVTADKNQRLIMIALPFVFVPFIQSFPAGLILYWITTNLWTVGQQTLIRRSAGMPVGIRSRPAEPPAQPAGSRAVTRAGSGSKGAKDEKGGTATRTVAPPASPRKKKKRSGRRR
jgi:YidC/Oxa1 family membrane protein insertase